MICHCPHCQISGSLEIFITGAAAKRFADLALKTPPGIGKLIPRYLRLFAPKSQSLRWERAFKLFEKLYLDIDRRMITRKNRDWSAPLELWESALQTVIDRADQGALETPLKDHAYLYEIISRTTDKAEAIAEKQTEQQKRSHTGVQSMPQSMNALIENSTRTDTEPKHQHKKREPGFVKNMLLPGKETDHDTASSD